MGFLHSTDLCIDFFKYKKKAETKNVCMYQKVLNAADRSFLTGLFGQEAYFKHTNRKP